jgi:O-antigen ligase
LDRIAAGIAITATLYSGSRSGYLGLAVAALALLALRAIDLRAVLRDLAAAALIMTAIALVRLDYVKYLVALLEAGAGWIERTLSQGAPGGAGDFGLALPVAPVFGANLLPGLQSALLATSVEQRVNISAIAFEMWQQSPIIGIGLGSFLHAQAVAEAEPLQLIHTSGLWLLTETGLVGTLLVVGFGLYCVRALLAERSALSRAALGMIAVFVAGSVGNELMYQRYFWFFLGLALTAPLTTAPPRRLH